MDDNKLAEADKLFVILITDACKTIEKMYGDAICERLMDEYLLTRDDCACPVCDMGDQVTEQKEPASDFDEFMAHAVNLINCANKLQRK